MCENVVIPTEVMVALITSFAAIVAATYSGAKSRANISKEEFKDYQERRDTEMQNLEKKIDNLNELTSSVVRLTEQNVTLFTNQKTTNKNVEKLEKKIDKLTDTVLQSVKNKGE